MVEDYTNAFLVSTFFLVLMALIAISVHWGMFAAIGSGWLADWALAHLSHTH